MEPAHALADLLVASPQVEAATVFGPGDEPLGSFGLDARAAHAVARAGRAMLGHAAGFRGVGEPTQVHAALEGGDVFVVGRESGPGIVAVTASGQLDGLLFHQLKRCLAAVAEADA